MCNEHDLREEAQARSALRVTRRDFNLLALSAAAVALLPTGARAEDEVVEGMIEVPMAQGKADCYFAHPAKGRHPAVMLWPDFMSLRPTYQQLAKRLAQSGYAVLAINTYYRDARSPLTAKADFDNQELMQKIRTLAGQQTEAGIDSDARDFIKYLDNHAAVDAKRPMGVMGYCATGRHAFRTAAAVPERVGAMATFHGGGLVSEGPDSPHRLIAKMRAQALIAIAAGDDEKEPTVKDALREAFAKAKLTAQVEVYADTVHGFCTPDMTSRYNEAAAQRAWSRLLALLDRATA